MRSVWVPRLFFALVAAMAIAGIASGTACTRWGQPGPITPTLAPISALYVDPRTGSDTAGNGSQTKPYKSLTKAVAVLAAAKLVSPTGVSIFLSTGNYSTRSGEVFPIVLTRSVSILGTNYGHGGPRNGSFINGVGEDTLFESIVHAQPKTAYATLEVAPTINVSLSDLYVGSKSIHLPGSKAGYVAVDTFGSLTVTDALLGTGSVTALRGGSGVLVAGGAFTCTSCQIHGNAFAVGGISVPLATASPYATPPSITLQRGDSDSTVAAKIVDIATDGSVDVSTTNETFARSRYAFADVLSPVVSTSTRGVIDFGGGGSSTGGNTFIGALVTEILIKRRYETVNALDDTWNPREQHANRNGQYVRKMTFGSGTTGKNVTVDKDATGSTVTVGPAIVPTPTPSGSPGPTATPT